MNLGKLSICIAAILWSARADGLPPGVFKLAAVQSESVWFDIDGGITKAIGIVEKAGSAGEKANLIAFGESWLGGYPFYVWVGNPAFAIQFHPAFMQSAAMDPDDPVDKARIERLQDAAKKNDISIVMGFNLRKGHSLWIAQFMIDNLGVLRFVRRKLKATHAERAIYADGDGSDFHVEKIEGLGLVGALNCWEHLQPQNKLVQFGMHEEIHVAAWPAFVVYDGVAYQLSAEANMAVSKVYALEGGAYVLSATTIVTDAYRRALEGVIEQLKAAHAMGAAPPPITLDMVPYDMALPPVGGGSAAIFGPDGKTLTDPTQPKAETCVYAMGSLAAIAAAKATADPVGHYARPDVHTLRVNVQQGSPVQLLSKHAESGDGTSTPGAESAESKVDAATFEL